MTRKSKIPRDYVDGGKGSAYGCKRQRDDIGHTSRGPTFGVHKGQECHTALIPHEVAYGLLAITDS